MLTNRPKALGIIRKLTAVWSLLANGGDFVPYLRVSMGRSGERAAEGERAVGSVIVDI